MQTNKIAKRAATGDAVTRRHHYDGGLTARTNHTTNLIYNGNNSHNYNNNRRLETDLHLFFVGKTIRNEEQPFQKQNMT